MQSSAQDKNPVPDQMPQYTGGMLGMKLFLMDNLQYPTDAFEQGAEGRILVKFVIDKDGTVTDAKILSNQGKNQGEKLPESCEQEALRVVNLMPKWQPGMKDGQPVKVSYTLPVGFYMQLPDIKE